MKEDNCIFCKIVDGDIPSHKIYENNDYIAFLDINPQTEGEVLVIPKKHHRWVYDVEDFGEYWNVAKKVTELLMKKLNPEFVTYYTYGMDVPHAHIHVLPRKNRTDGLNPKEKLSPSNEELKVLAEKISN